jgi:DNA polymerase-3 subunit gamma/tau
MRDTIRRQSERWGLETVSAAMQIIAETKSRMQRSNSPRALFEMALIRVSLLEQLDDLALLVDQLQSGQGLTGTPVVPAPQSRSGGSTRSARPMAVKKKDAESPIVAAAEADTQVALSPEPQELVDFTPENVDAFFSQLVLHSTDATENQLKRASQVAIFGPNGLDLVFPKSYVFSKNYCERSETLNTLKELASKLAGKPIDITIRLDESSEAPVAIQSQREPIKSRRSTTAAADDALVNAALSMFGGAVVEVQSIPPSGASEG